MPNKTIYVSEQDASLFDQAKDIAGEALSSVISKALREYVARHQQREQGMSDLSLQVGRHGGEREVRFVGKVAGNWQGFSNDDVWWMGATIYQTQKGKWAVHLKTIAKASMFTNPKAWKTSGDYFIDYQSSELIVEDAAEDFESILPSDLYASLLNCMSKTESSVEYLDI